MMKTFFGKGFYLPSLHSRCHGRDPVHSARPVRNITPDILKTLTPEKLARASHIILTFKAVFARVITSVLCEWRSTHTEIRILAKLPHHEFHVVRFEGNIGVQVSQDLERERLNLFEGGINGLRLRSKIAVLALVTLDQFDPRITGRVALDDFGRLISRTVVDNDPAFRQNCLGNHRGKGLFNESFLVARSCD